MPLRLGLLGAWHPHVEGMTRQIAAHPDEFTLVGFHESDPRLAASRQVHWAERFPALPSFATPDQLLAQPLDAVVVEGRVFENVAYARRAIESGRPVLLEKPAGENLADFRALVELADSRGLRVQLTYLFRYMSAVRELLDRGRRGELGQIYEFRARLPKPPHEYDGYVRDLGRYRGGMFFEMAGHVVDMLVTLLGPPRKVTPFLAHHHSVPGDFIDNAVAVYEFAGAWGIIEMPAIEVAPKSRRIEVYGGQGACIIPNLGSGHLTNSPTQPLDVCRAGDHDWTRLDLPASPLQIGDLREFAAVIAGQKPPDYPSAHDLQVHEALLRGCGMLP